MCEEYKDNEKGSLASQTQRGLLLVSWMGKGLVMLSRFPCVFGIYSRQRVAGIIFDKAIN